MRRASFKGFIHELVGIKPFAFESPKHRSIQFMAGVGCDMGGLLNGLKQSGFNVRRQREHASQFLTKENPRDGIRGGGGFKLLTLGW
jgi:hypothetical protein